MAIFSQASCENVPATGVPGTQHVRAPLLVKPARAPGNPAVAPATSRYGYSEYPLTAVGILNSVLPAVT